MTAVEVADLVVHHDALAAVDGITFSASEGAVTALIGRNGAGKTTTVETIAGLLAPSSGSVRVLGLDPRRDRKLLTPSVGVMPQNVGLYPGAKPLELVRTTAAFYQSALDPIETLERVGLQTRATMTCRAMSGGERQRLSLALALIGQPKVVLLDEPTAGIDPAGRLLIRQVIGDLTTAGVCVLVTTHDLEEAEKVASQVVIINEGKIVASGTPTQLLRSTGAEIRFSAPSGIDTALLGKTLMAAVDERSPGDYVVGVEPTPSNISALTSWLAENDLPLIDLKAGRQSLEDLFFQMTAITGETPVVRVERPDG